MARMPPRGQLGRTQPDHAGQRLRPEVLYHLGAEDAVESGVRLAGQVVEQVGSFGFKTFVPAIRGGFFAEIYPSGRYVHFPHGFEELAPAAAYVEYVGAGFEEGFIEGDVLANIVFGAPETFGKSGVIERRLRGSGRNGLSGVFRKPCSFRRAPLPDQPEFAVDQPLEFPADLFHVGPQALLNVDGGTVESSEIIVMLRRHHVSEVRFHQGCAVLRRALQIGYTAQELNFVDCQLFFPFGPPFDPVAANVFEFNGLGLQEVADGRTEGARLPPCGHRFAC